MSSNRLFIRILPLSILATLGGAAIVSAQGFDVEPNDTCLTAQAVGSWSIPYSIAGTLESVPDVANIDFYQFAGTPGAKIRIELLGEPSGHGTLGDPLLGLLDTSCEVLDSDDDSGQGANSRFDVTVPDDGTFVVAVTSCCDWDLAGVGSSSGTYELTLALPPPPIGSISGRIVDSVTGTPLTGDEDPYASAWIYRWDEDGYFDSVGRVDTNGDGEFTLDASNAWDELPAGTYKIEASAWEHESKEVGPFDVASGQKIDVGDIELLPPAIVITNVVPCVEIPAAGGMCTYTLTVQNNRNTRLRGMAWSVVDARSLGPGGGGRSEFEAQKRRVLNLRPLGKKKLKFTFRVPGDVQPGAWMDVSFLVGVLPGAQLRPLYNERLFTVGKQDVPSGTFGVLTQKEVEARKSRER